MRLIDLDALPSGRVEWEDIVNSPTVDAVPVKHGRWIKDRLVATSGGTYGIRRCSVCEWYFEDLPYEFKHCPHCGARMDGAERKDDETD